MSEAQKYFHSKYDSFAAPALNYIDIYQAFEAGQRTLPQEVKELMADIIKYVEDTAVQIDGEWGSVRTLEELIAEGLMPDIYTKLKEAQNE